VSFVRATPCHCFRGYTLPLQNRQKHRGPPGAHGGRSGRRQQSAQLCRCTRVSGRSTTDIVAAASVVVANLARGMRGRAAPIMPEEVACLRAALRRVDRLLAVGVWTPEICGGPITPEPGARPRHWEHANVAPAWPPPQLFLAAAVDFWRRYVTRRIACVRALAISMGARRKRAFHAWQVAAHWQARIPARLCPLVPCQQRRLLWEQPLDYARQRMILSEWGALSRRNQVLRFWPWRVQHSIVVRGCVSRWRKRVRSWSLRQRPSGVKPRAATVW
jgi:hypothetical protein